MEKIRTKMLNIMLPEELIYRVIAVCSDQDMTIQEFVNDAIFEKLNHVYKEKRRKPIL
jgi:hypothetical protein